MLRPERVVSRSGCRSRRAAARNRTPPAWRPSHCCQDPRPRGRPTMKERLRAVILAAVLTAVTMSLVCETPQAGTIQVSFQSSTYSDFRQLLAREVAAGTVTVRANLGFPKEPKARYPAAVIVHTIGGYREANEGYAAAELRKSGFATLTYDSFAARETTGLRMSGSPGFLPGGVAEAYAAVRLLAIDPRIDVDRIAIG